MRGVWEYKGPELCDSGERRVERLPALSNFLFSLLPPTSSFPRGRVILGHFLTSSIFNLKVMCTKIHTIPPKLQNPISYPGSQTPFPEATTVTIYCFSSRNILCICSIQTHAYVHTYMHI